MYPHIAYISVGSNLGNKLDNCRSGIAALMDSMDIRLIDQSPIYRTEPVDCQDQDWFANFTVDNPASQNAQKALCVKTYL